ncbi:serine/threonine protein kinase [Pseudomonas sp. SDI]|uniref:serine/threonine-protein kinase n=1 Tax=Pseudomonas sp. SDI TaxID=2170734 RepID=UPI000DE70BF4|nr:serine/threonine-protein kinase [Pseudomonas sp. SDI]PWB31958.1 serine/threonine protein kinase [Pseudomonas sp. SDI]
MNEWMAADLAIRSAGGIPDVLSGRYRLEGLLGAGGMGMVYRARDLLLEQFGDPAPYVALKLLREDVADCPDAAALLYGEFALTRHLQHRNIVRAFSFEVDTRFRQAYFTMELLRGMPLDRLLCEHPQGLAWTRGRGIALALLDAVGHAHRQGVVHGDLKPGNLLLGEQYVHLFDFGLSQPCAGEFADLPRLSRSRFNAWTPGYAAPELFEGAGLSQATDLYAAACVIYELAGGKHPLRYLNATQIREQPAAPHLLRPVQLPASCWPALRSALALNPEARRIEIDGLRETLANSTSSWLPGCFRRYGSRCAAR